MFFQRIYGWRGAVLILSGVMANMCVSASIMFPVDITEDCVVGEKSDFEETSENTKVSLILTSLIAVKAQLICPLSFESFLEI